MYKNNLLEFKELILKYESIDITDIGESIANNAESYSYIEGLDDLRRADFISILADLTGFNDNATCTLCIALDLDKIDEALTEDACKNCVWMKKVDTQCWSQPTYIALEQCDTIDAFIIAIEKRADFMRKTIGWYKKSIDYNKELNK